MQSSSLDHKSRTPEGYIHFGSISGVFGVHGEVKLFLHNLNSSLFDQWISVRLLSGEDLGEVIDIKLRRGSGKKVVGKIRIAERIVTSPEEARSFMQQDILIAEESLPSLDVEEFYHHDLLGLPVIDQEGLPTGTVIEITPGTVDVLTIQTPERDLLYIPFISEKVLSVSQEGLVIQRYSEPES